MALARAPRVRARIAARFLLGLPTGAVCFWGTLYWLVETMTTFGGMPVPLAVVAAGLLVAYLSLFPGAFAVWWCGSRRRAPGLLLAARLGRERARAAGRAGTASPGSSLAIPR